MQLNVYKDYQELSFYVAESILSTVKSHPEAVLCLATGDSPRLAYELLAKMAIDEKVAFNLCTFIALDEWVGVPPQNEGSCRFFLESQVFKPLQILPSQVYLFDALSSDLEEECRKIDKIIAEKDGIDLMLVGVGINGHIGFNEPGVSTDEYAHVINLDETTRSVGQKYFTQAIELKQGITLGFKHILNAKKVIMMASGVKKAAVIQKTIEEEITNNLPASILRNHSQCRVMIDEDAASLLNKSIE